MGEAERTRMHQSIGLLGMRAQATAAGLVQLCHELRARGLLDDESIERIKEAIADELVDSAPRSMTKSAFRSTVQNRLDRVFEGVERVGPLPPNSKSQQ